MTAAVPGTTSAATGEVSRSALVSGALPVPSAPRPFPSGRSQPHTAPDSPRWVATMLKPPASRGLDHSPDRE